MTALVLDVQRTHIINASPKCRFSGRPSQDDVIGASLILKGLMMTPKFLCEEAARFRGMAGTADLEASKLRLLAMATDFESRAAGADGSIEPKLDEGIKAKVGKKIAKD
jgi:hypothetical protein